MLKAPRHLIQSHTELPKKKAKTNKKKERKKEGSLVGQLPCSHCFNNTKLLKLSFTNAPHNPILRPKHHF